MPEELEQPFEPKKASILALYRKEPRSHKLTYAIFVIWLLGFICQNTLESFAPGQFLIFREFLVVPILSLFAFGIYRMISTVSIMPGLYFLIAAYITSLTVSILRKEGIASAIGIFFGEGFFFGLMTYVLMSQATKPTPP